MQGTARPFASDPRSSTVAAVVVLLVAVLAALLLARRHERTPAAVLAAIAGAGAVVAASRSLRRRNGAASAGPRFGLPRRADREYRSWQYFLEHTGWGVVGVDSRDRMAVVSSTFAAMHGYTVDELRGRNVVELHPPEARADVQRELERGRAEGHHVFEAVHVRKDGSRFPVLVDSSTIVPQRGREPFRFAYVQDLTERRTAENARAQLAALVESSDDAIGVVGLDGTVLTWNAAAERLYGYAADEIVGRPVDTIVPPEHRAERAATFARIGRGETVDSQLATRRRKDGTELRTSVTYSPVRDGGGNVVAVSGISRDITERMRAYEGELQALALAEHERARLRTVVEQVPVGIMFKERQSGETLVNPALTGILRATDCRLDPGSRLLTSDGARVACEEAPVERALRGEVTRNAEFLGVREDGTRIPLLINAAPVRDASGDILASVMTVLDISSRKELESLREEYLGLVSHDLRSPLANILARSQLLERALRAPGREKELGSAESIVVSARRMEAMIAEILESSRLESGRVTLQPEAVDLAAFLGPVLDRAVSPDERGRARLEVPSDLPPAWADPAQLERIVVNLVTNAFKYGGPGTVHVAAQSDEDRLLVTVADHGDGIPEQAQSRLFDKFYRTSAKTQVKGFGLGLYITRLLVEAQGGHIWVKSAPHEGARFTFSVPTARSRSAAALPAA